MGIREDLERAFTDWDTGMCPGGDFRCSYSEEYAESLDAQGVDRAVTLPRHVATLRLLEVGSTIDWIRTKDGEYVGGPFTIETYEPSGRHVVRLRLRGP